MERTNALVLTERSESLRGDLRKYTKAFDSLAKLQPLSNKNDRAVPRAILLLGPSRSGKTTLESLICQLDGVDRGFEASPFNKALTDTLKQFRLKPTWDLLDLPEDHHELFNKNVEKHLRELGDPDKMLTLTNPGLAMNAAVLASVVPNLRIVFVKRDKHDIALRMFQTHYRSDNAYSFNLKTIKRHIEWYNDMMHAMKSKFPDIVHVVNYEDMVEDPKGTLEFMAEICGLPAPEGEIEPVPDDRGCSEPYKEFFNLQ